VPVFEEEFTVDAAPDAVWMLLLDPLRVARCIPGCDSVEVEDARTYRARITVRVGFLSTTQNLRVDIVEAERPRRLVSVGRGEDRKLASHVEVNTSLELEPTAAGGTLLRYVSDVRVLGRLGSVGDAVMKVKVKQLTGEFAANLRATMGGRPS
jgi:carbon monoxide dehydrogenase subunit G